jgi:hypothetical protein
MSQLKKIKRGIKMTLRQAKMEIQHTRTYGMRQKMVVALARVVAVKGLRNCKIKDMSCIRMKKIDLLLD